MTKFCDVKLQVSYFDKDGKKTGTVRSAGEITNGRNFRAINELVSELLAEPIEQQEIEELKGRIAALPPQVLCEAPQDPQGTETPQDAA